MDLNRLEELAKVATPGPWFRSPELGVRLDGWSTVRGREDNRPIARIRAVDREELWPDPNEQTGRDAAYIAAVDPQTMLQLIAEVREARRGSSSAVPVEHVAGEVVTDESYQVDQQWSEPPDATR